MSIKSHEQQTLSLLFQELLAEHGFRENAIGDTPFGAVLAGLELPTQTTQSGKYLTTDGSAASWATVTVPSLGNFVFTTNGADLSGAAVMTIGGTTATAINIKSPDAGCQVTVENGKVKMFAQAGADYIEVQNGELDEKIGSATTRDVTATYHRLSAAGVLGLDLAATTTTLKANGNALVSGSTTVSQFYDATGAFAVSATNALTVIRGAAAADNTIQLSANGIGGAGKIGFYGATPVVLQTGVLVTAAGIHAALVNLGLITA